MYLLSLFLLTGQITRFGSGCATFSLAGKRTCFQVGLAPAEVALEFVPGIKKVSPFDKELATVGHC